MWRYTYITVYPRVHTWSHTQAHACIPTSLYSETFTNKHLLCRHAISLTQADTISKSNTLSRTHVGLCTNAHLIFYRHTKLQFVSKWRTRICIYPTAFPLNLENRKDIDLEFLASIILYEVPCLWMTNVSKYRPARRPSSTSRSILKTSPRHNHMVSWGLPGSRGEGKPSLYMAQILWCVGVWLPPFQCFCFFGTPHQGQRQALNKYWCIDCPW